MQVFINETLYSIPQIYWYKTETDARINSMNFSVCGYKPSLDDCCPVTAKPKKSPFYYRGNRVNLSFPN